MKQTSSKLRAHIVHVYFKYVCFMFVSSCKRRIKLPLYLGPYTLRIWGAMRNHNGTNGCHMCTCILNLAPVGANTMHMGACWCLRLTKVPDVTSRY